MKTIRNIMFSVSIVLFLLIIGIDKILNDLQFYYRSADHMDFQVMLGCVITGFLLIGISLHFAVLLKEKQKLTGALVVVVAISIFAVAYFGICALGNGRDADMKYFSFSSPDNKYTIVISEARGFL